MVGLPSVPANLGIHLVLALALGGVGTYVAYAAQHEMEEFDRKIEQAKATRLQRIVSGSYSNFRQGGELRFSLEQASALFDRRIVITDRQGDVVGDSGRRYGAPKKLDRRRGRLLPLKVGGNEVGSILVGPNNAPEQFPDPPVTEVTSALNNSLVWTGVAAGLAGIVLISLVSRRILVPLQALSTASHRLGEGNLSARASASGPVEIQQLAHTFNSMAQNLETSERQRRNLVADVAHELRTPVSNIQIYLEAIEDGLLETNDALEKINGQTYQLTALIEVGIAQIKEIPSTM